MSRLSCESRFSVYLSGLTIARGLSGMAGDRAVRLEPESPAGFIEVTSARDPGITTGGKTELVEAEGPVGLSVLACGVGWG